MPQLNLDDILGTRLTLRVKRFGSPGAFLALDEDEAREGGRVVLLPGAEIPEGCEEGDSIEVFMTLDSDDRPLATRVMPKLMRGEVAFLKVAALTEFGAFFDWGLPKQLLVPKGEQTRDVYEGEVHPVALYMDDTGRLAGTMKVREHLTDMGDFAEDEWVEGEAWRNEPELGVFVILERAFLGLLPAAEPHELQRGQSAQFRVTNVLPDGKIELSLRGHAYEERADDAETLRLYLLTPDAEPLSDKSAPDLVRKLLKLSKKAFKRAAGKLLRERVIDLTEDGTFVMVPPRAKK